MQAVVEEEGMIMQVLLKMLEEQGVEEKSEFIAGRT